MPDSDRAAYAIAADILAHIHWFGAENLGSSSALLVALLRSWEARFRATLVGHFGTMLHFEVERPPTTMDGAWEIAFEQDTVAGYTLSASGVALRDHAQNLVDLGTWFLHERP